MANGQYATDYKNLWYWVYLIDNQVRILTAEEKDEVRVESFDTARQAFEAYHNINLDLAKSTKSLCEIVSIRCRIPYGKPSLLKTELPSSVQKIETARMLHIMGTRGGTS